MWELETIGKTAGLVWKFLQSNGESSISAVAKGVKAPGPMVSMAVGWLAARASWKSGTKSDLFGSH
jgi:hypothetical protein